MSTRTAWQQNWLFILSVAAMIGIVAWLGFYPPGPTQSLRPGVTLDTAHMATVAAGTVTALLVVTLLVERALAVVNALLFGDEQRAADLQLRRADPATQATAESALAAVMRKKERLRLLLGFGVALFVSAAGIRSLQGLVIATPPQPLTPLFYGVDIVVTAGLIAGGSNGLALLLEAIKNIFNKTPPDEARLRTRMVSGA